MRLSAAQAPKFLFHLRHSRFCRSGTDLRLHTTSSLLVSKSFCRFGTVIGGFPCRALFPLR